MRNRKRDITLLAGALTCALAIAGQEAPAQRGWPRGNTSVADKIQASPLLVDLNGDGTMEILVPSFDDKLYIYNHDGTTFNPGGSPWPKVLGFGDGTIASVAVGQVDGDSALEIVVVGDNKSAQSATLKVYEIDGTAWSSVTLGSLASAKATPCLIDVYRYSGETRHEAEEILIRDGDGKVHIFYWNGTGLSTLYSSPTFDTVATDANRDRFGILPITSSISARYRGDGITYLAVGSSDSKVYRWKVTSTAETNWQVTALDSLVGGDRFLGSPVLVDLDGDSSVELVASSLDHSVYVWDWDATTDEATLRDGWPQSTGAAIFSSPAVADIDGDGYLEIIVGSDDSKIHVWKHDGSPLTGWPQETLGDVFSGPVAEDIDGDGLPEIFATSFDGHLYGWDGSGDLLAGWPKRLNTVLYASPAVGDIHQSGRMSVVTAGFDGTVFCFDLAPKYGTPISAWPQFRGGPRRQGSR